MHTSVRAAFISFTSTFEGVCSWMYLDVKGLVTTAIGNLIDPVQVALGLPFAWPDGEPATVEEIEAEWNMVKGRKDLMLRGGGAYKQITNLRLTPGGIDQVVGKKLADNDARMRIRFPLYDVWPADAQLAALSMSWACGPAFHFPRLDMALHARDFALAAEECKIVEVGNPGIVPRNKANRTLFYNAYRSEGMSLDPERLWYPRVLGDEPPTDVEGTRIIHPPIDFPPRDPPDDLE